MAIPRSSSFKALQNLGQAGQARRSLHITGSKSSPQIRRSEPKRPYAPLTHSDLRIECQRRSLLSTGTKHELVDRLAVHDNLQSRAFSIAMRRRGLLGAKSAAEETPSRQFNTSPRSTSSYDHSSIDFAYLPKLFDGSLDPPQTSIRVPILPNVDSTDAQSVLAQNPKLGAAAGGLQESDNVNSNEVMKAQIVTVQETMADGGAHVDLGAEGRASHMSEATDNQTVELGIEHLTEFAARMTKPDSGAQEEASDLRKLWNGLMDDLFGEKKENGSRLV